jgi:hypothetical protein
MKRQTYLFYTVQYGSVGRKWAFRWPGGNTLLVECKGKLMADAVARIVAGSLKRNDNRLDGLARANISAILNRSSETE